jgi:hypothetical protein
MEDMETTSQRVNNETVVSRGADVKERLAEQFWPVE